VFRISTSLSRCLDETGLHLDKCSFFIDRLAKCFARLTFSTVDCLFACLLVCFCFSVCLAVCFVVFHIFDDTWSLRNSSSFLQLLLELLLLELLEQQFALFQ
jgi:hypothetical protein